MTLEHYIQGEGAHNTQLNTKLRVLVETVCGILCVSILALMQHRLSEFKPFTRCASSIAT